MFGPYVMTEIICMANKSGKMISAKSSIEIHEQNIQSVWWNFIKSSNFIMVCISGHKWSQNQAIYMNNPAYNSIMI